MTGIRILVALFMLAGEVAMWFASALGLGLLAEAIPASITGWGFSAFLLLTFLAGPFLGLLASTRFFRLKWSRGIVALVTVLLANILLLGPLWIISSDGIVPASTDSETLDVLLGGVLMLNGPNEFLVRLVCWASVIFLVAFIAIGPVSSRSRSSSSSEVHA